MNRKKLLKVLKNVGFLAFGSLLLWWSFREMKISTLLETLREANYVWVFLAMVLGLLSHLSRAMRWRLLITGAKESASLRSTFLGVMSGYLMNFIVPRMGEVSRCAVVNQREDIPIDKLIGTVITERLFDLITLGLISVGIYMYQFELINNFLQSVLPNDPCNLTAGAVEESNNWGKIITLSVLALVVLFVAYKLLQKPKEIKQKLITFIRNSWSGVMSITKLRNPWQFVFHTIFIWAMYFLTAYFIFFALDTTNHLGVFAGLFVLLVGTLAIIIPVPGGLGTFHTMVMLGLSMPIFQLTCEEGLQYATVSHGAQMVMIFVVGGLSLLVISLDRKKKKTSNEDK
jgi:glycosyltransferase 2 family protein